MIEQEEPREGTDFKDFKEEVLKDPEERAEYDKLQPKYDLIQRQIEIREGIALRLHTQERALLKITYENSPNNCRWEELPEFTKDYYRKDADRFLKYLDSQGLEIVKYPKQGDDLTGTHTVWSEPLIKEGRHVGRYCDEDSIG